MLRRTHKIEIDVYLVKRTVLVGIETPYPCF